MPRLLSTLLLVVVVASGVAAAAEADRFRYLAAIYVGDKGVGMRYPEGVACNDRALVVADTGNGRLLRYTVDERDVKAAGEIVVPQATTPSRVQLTSKEEILVLDSKQRRIVRLDAKGAFKGYLSTEGVPEPTAIVPRSLKVDRDDGIYVLDVFSARVLVLDREGKFQRQVPFPKDRGFFSDLAVDAKGAIFLLDSIRVAVHVAQKDAKEFTPLGKNLRTHMSFPTSMLMDARGILYIVDEHGAGIVLLAQDGSVLGRQLAMGWTDGLVYYPAQICRNDRGQLFVADRGNSRVQVFGIVR